MDKRDAIKRLDALEGEAKKLREIIEKGDKLVYDSSKIYVGVREGVPYLMVGNGDIIDGKDFLFMPFDRGRRALTAWAPGKSTGQECLDYHIHTGFDIHAFKDTREAFQFFLNNLK
jgi:hypothetical protein